MNRKTVILFFLIALTLSACSNKMVEVAEKNEKESLADSENRRQTKEEIEKEQAKIYKEMEKPLEEIVKNNDLKQMEIQESTAATVQDHYEDENEFAKYAASLLFGYQSSKITPKEYFNFLMNHGAASIVSEMPADEKDAILIYSNVQSLLSETQFVSYTLSKVGLNQTKREGYFYRLVNTAKGEAYYITTIIKEDGKWKFLEDSPAPPFKIVETLEEGE